MDGTAPECAVAQQLGSDFRLSGRPRTGTGRQVESTRNTKFALGLRELAGRLARVYALHSRKLLTQAVERVASLPAIHRRHTSMGRIDGASPMQCPATARIFEFAKRPALGPQQSRSP